jgi:hypothetical protein
MCLLLVYSGMSLPSCYYTSIAGVWRERLKPHPDEYKESRTSESRNTGNVRTTEKRETQNRMVRASETPITLYQIS